MKTMIRVGVVVFGVAVCLWAIGDVWARGGRGGGGGARGGGGMSRGGGGMSRPSPSVSRTPSMSRPFGACSPQHRRCARRGHASQHRCSSWRGGARSQYRHSSQHRRPSGYGHAAQHGAAHPRRAICRTS